MRKGLQANTHIETSGSSRMFAIAAKKHHTVPLPLLILRELQIRPVERPRIRRDGVVRVQRLEAMERARRGATRDKQRGREGDMSRGGTSQGGRGAGGRARGDWASSDSS
jgi:uncharacterized membrane protein YgcG